MSTAEDGVDNKNYNNEASGLRVALVRQRYTAFGGAERYTDRAMDALRKRGVSVSVIAREWRGDSPFEIVETDPFYLGRRWRDRSFHDAACRVVASNGYDIVQSHERLACCDIFRAGDGLHRVWLEQRGRLRGAFSRLAAKLSPYHRYVTKAEERMFKSSSLKAVICNSRMVQKQIQEHFDLPDELFHVIYTGVDSNHYDPKKARVRGASLRDSYGIDDACPIMLLVGSGYERKGVAQFLQALAKTDESVRGWIIGNDREPGKYEKMAAKLGIDHRVMFLGPQKDVIPYYGAADALVLPSLYDPFPNVTLEAMACGLPVVVSDQCGTIDIVRDGENGYIRDALDIDGIADAITKLSDGDVRGRLSQAARESVLPLGMPDMAAELEKLYESVATKKA